MAFEVYRSKAHKDGKVPVVSLSKASIVLNKIARDKLNHPEYVELAFDREGNAIRIRPSAINEGHLLKKTKILAKGFYKYFDLNVTGKYKADYNSEDNALYFNLSPDKKL